MTYPDYIDQEFDRLTYLVDRLADAFECPDQSKPVASEIMRSRYPLDRIWSLAINEYIRRHPKKTLWQRITSFFTSPTPDNRPGGMWR